MPVSYTITVDITEMGTVIVFIYFHSSDTFTSWIMLDSTAYFSLFCLLIDIR